MDTSVFTDPSHIPSDADLEMALGRTYIYWKEIANYVSELDPDLELGWNFSSPKYGWSFRIRDKKRAIIYLLPRQDYFMVAFVFGQKATDQIFKSDVSNHIKSELSAARVYSEGRGIRIAVKEKSDIRDITLLADIKTKN